MSDANDNDGVSKDYYAAGSYQQGSNSAVAASSDQAYAERLQQQEFGNAQQVRRSFGAAVGARYAHVCLSRLAVPFANKRSAVWC